MHNMIKLVVYASFILSLVGCTGLGQFPEASEDYTKDLEDLDVSYHNALAEIETAKGNAAEQKRIRDEEIDRRLRVIDLNFTAFETGLAQENVRVEFLVSVVEVGVGGAGSLVGETASQILSAVSGGLAGGQQAYSKAALFDKTLSALLAQMIAGRKTILVKILEGRARGIDEYPLSAAARDLEAYYFAGSLPGAIVGTAADAKVKNDQAEDELAAFRENVFGDDTSGRRIRAFIRPPDGKATDTVDEANLQKVADWIEKSKVAGLPIANFLTNPALAAMRGRMIQDLLIP